MSKTYDLQTMAWDLALGVSVPLTIYLMVYAAVTAFLIGYARKKAGTIKIGRAKLRFAVYAGYLWPRLIPALLQDLFDSNH